MDSPYVFANQPTFCTAGVKTPLDGTTLSQGYVANQYLPCEYYNYLENAVTTNLNIVSSGINNVNTELDNLLTTFGATPNASIHNQLAAMWGAGWPAALTTNTLNFIIPPIGYVYIQGLNDASPATLWPSATWANVSSEEAGLFRRFEGGNAAAFQQIQVDTFATHTHGINDPSHNHIIMPDDLGGNTGSPNHYTLFLSDNLPVNNLYSQNSNTGVTVQGPNSGSYGVETKPVNVTVRKWRRTA